MNADNAEIIYDTIEKRLREPDFLPRNLFEKFNIEVLSTTDSASDKLEYHQIIKDSGWKGKVIPTFRPDAAVNLDKPNWKSEIDKLSEVVGETIDSFSKFINALEERRIFFKNMGAVATDHGVRSPFTYQLSKSEAEAIFQKALRGEVTESDAKLFTANMLMEFARMSIEDGLVMQIHPGSLRDHNNLIYEKFGTDKGCDIPEQTEYTNNLKELLNKYGNNSSLSIILFTLDESTYSRELAPLAGHYPALKLGPPWWFHDSIQGMIRYRQRVTETAGFFNTVGFNDDTRAFLSIPARHDVARRVDSNFLAGLVTKHIITFDEAKMLSKELAYNLVKKGYKL
ncbi:uronate isomerase [bacterium BMS3Abin04]|nr:uronate isomerase [bacterium BMS3Abin04]